MGRSRYGNHQRYPPRPASQIRLDGLQQLQRDLALSLPALGAAAAVIGLAGHGVVDTIFFRPEVQITGWFALATLGAARQLR